MGFNRENSEGVAGAMTSGWNILFLILQMVENYLDTMSVIYRSIQVIKQAAGAETVSR